MPTNFVRHRFFTELRVFAMERPALETITNNVRVDTCTNFQTKWLERSIDIGEMVEYDFLLVQILTIQSSRTRRIQY